MPSVQLKLSAITGGFKADMREAQKSMREWKEGVESLSRSASSVQNFSSSISGLAGSLASGDIAGALGGIVGAAQAGALALPQMGLGVKSISTMAGAVAPVAAALAGVAVIVGAVAAAVWLGKSAWDATAESLEGVARGYRSFDSVAAKTQGSLKSMREETAKLNKELGRVGLTSTQAAIADAKTQYEQLKSKLAMLQEIRSKQEDKYAQAMSQANAKRGGAAGAFERGVMTVSEVLTGQYAGPRVTAADIELERQGLDLIDKELGQTYLQVDAAKTLLDTKTEVVIATKEAVDAQKEWVDLETTAIDLANKKAKVTAGLERKTIRIGQLPSEVSGTAVSVGMASPLTAAGQAAAGMSDWTKIKAIGEKYGGQILGSMGSVGQIASAFASQGPVGGLVALGTNLLQRMPAFQKIMAQLETFLDFLAKALEPIIEAIAPLIPVVIDFAKLFVQIGMIFTGTGPAMKILGAVMEKTAWILNEIVGAISRAYNWIIDQIASIADSFDIFGAGFADSIRSYKVDLSGVGEAFTDMTWKALETAKDVANSDKPRTEKGSNQAGFRVVRIDSAANRWEDQMGRLGAEGFRAAGNLGDLADKTAKATEALSNVPSGYKVALARFEATAPTGPAATIAADIIAGQGGSIDQAAQTPAPIVVKEMTVQVPDLTAFVTEVQKTAARDTLVRTGSSSKRTGGPYASKRSGQVEP